MDYHWRPIEPLTEKEKSIDLSDIQPLGESWKEFKSRLKSSNPAGLKQFNERLVRSLSIETGILERIYELDRGTTEALIVKGFIEDLIQRDSTNIEPSRLVDILRDQEAAIYLVQDIVSCSRALTRGALFELHALLTRHQETTGAVDQLGQRIQIPLKRGAFKDHPNNPLRHDGTLHEYCPPEHVVSEIDNLLGWLSSSSGEDPILVSAWLHHRFTQIHPFQDGNGRLARVLTTLILLKGGLLPLVIDRDRRTDYIRALELADEGNLEDLVGLFSVLEKNAILQALSLDVEAERQAEKSLTGAVIESLEAKFSKRREAKRQDLLRVNSVAKRLREFGSGEISAKLQELTNRLFRREERPRVYVEEGGADVGNGYWYQFEITSLNEGSHKWINFNEDHYFIKANFRYETIRLVFLMSFHHVGRELTGVMEGTSFALVETFDEAGAGEGGSRERMGRKTIPASVEPFVISWKASADTLEPAFLRWLDSSLAIALKEWGDRM